MSGSGTSPQDGAGQGYSFGALPFGIAQFTLLDVKQFVSAAAIDGAALAAGPNEGSMPKGSAPKL